jgi:hypothetical protein
MPTTEELKISIYWWTADGMLQGSLASDCPCCSSQPPLWQLELLLGSWSSLKEISVVFTNILCSRQTISSEKMTLLSSRCWYLGVSLGSQSISVCIFHFLN